MEKSMPATQQYHGTAKIKTEKIKYSEIHNKEIFPKIILFLISSLISIKKYIL
jgi:hypothetical protein